MEYKERTMANWLSYEDAKAVVQRLGLHNRSEYQEYVRQNNGLNIPYHPETAYSDEWSTYENFLGVHRTPIADYETARQYARALRLATPQEWNTFVTSGNQPENIPHQP